MAALLPLAVYLALVLLFLERGDAPRRAFLTAAVGWGVFVVLITEFLSLLGALAWGPLVTVWTAALLVTGGLLAGVRRGGRDHETTVNRLRTGVSSALDAPLPGGFNGGSAILLGGVLLVAVVGAPNNGDSMSYHLPRVMHWVQNGSVAHYPSWIPRQLYQPPMAEFAVAHFQVLYGSDRLAGLVQWFCLAGSGLVASLVAARLGAGRVGQALAGLFVFTLPMGLLQGMTTQNDLVLSFWLAGGVYFCLEAFEGPRENIAWGSVLPLALCLGLAVLTKGTGYLFGFPLLGAAVLLALCRHGGRGLRVLLVCLVVVLLLNGGHYARNTAAFGQPLVPPDLPFPYLNRALTPATLASNVIRNVALQAATPFEAVNGTIVHTVEGLHGGLGLSVSDRRITWRYTTFGLSTKWTDENLAGNPLHLLLILLAVFGMAVRRRSNRSSGWGGLAIGVGVGYLVFCALVQWQPWHSRLHLPLLVTSAPLVGLWLDEGGFSRTIGGPGLLLLAVGLGVVTFNASHPMIGGPGNLFTTPRTAAYFTNRPGLRTPYGQLAERLKSTSCGRVGLMLRLEDWEYPLWVLLDDFGGEGGRVLHVDPPGKGSTPSFFVGRPDRVCRIVCTLPDCGERMEGSRWRLDWRSGSLQLWRPGDAD